MPYIQFLPLNKRFGFFAGLFIAAFGQTGFADNNLNSVANTLSRYSILTPSTNVIAPVAFGNSTGDFLASLNAITASTTSHQAVTSANIGTGLGDPNTGVSLTPSLSASLSPKFITYSGAAVFQLTHNFNKKTAFAIGVQNAFPWGDNASYGQSYYMVASKEITFKTTSGYHLPILFSAGIGNNQLANGTTLSQNSSIGPFGSLGLELLPRMTVILETAGRTYNAGVSFIPTRNAPFSLTLVANNVTHYAGSFSSYSATVAYAEHI